MRSPLASAWLICSSAFLTASSTSLKARWLCIAARASISSDLVMDAGSEFLRALKIVVVIDRIAPRPEVHSGPRHAMSLGLVELLLEQRTKLGRTTRRGLILLECLLHFVVVLGTDRQLQHAALAVHAGKLRLDLVADLQMLRSILDALLRNVGNAHVAFDTVGQLDRRTLGVDFLDRAVHDAAAQIGRHVLAERILLELLYAERNALAFRIDRKHDRLDRVALLELA